MTDKTKLQHTHSLKHLMLFADQWSNCGDNADHLSGLDCLLHDPALPADPLHLDWARDHAAVHVPSCLCAVLCDEHLRCGAAVGCLPQRL